MPASDRMNITMTPTARADLARLFELAKAQGVDLRYLNRVTGRLELSESKAVHWAMHLAATGNDGSHPKQTDGAALAAARKSAGIGQRELARVLGYEHHSIVGQMERGLIPLTEPARRWLASKA